MKIQIKSRFSDRVLFELEKEGNTIFDTLREAVNSGADLFSAYLRGTDLSWSNLNSSDLRIADLRYTSLCNARLRNADLREADLSHANLFCADLRGADLRGAELSGANLFGAELSGAKGIPNIPLACPSDGAFIGWKKVAGCLIKLLIPEDAKRCSATTRKCRCEFAKVLSITRIRDGEERKFIVNDDYAPSVVYRVGEIVKPDSFDEDRWNECSHGIHFFINKQDAIDY